MISLPDSDFVIMKEIFSKYPEIEEVILFGSRAKGTNRPGSDVDIVLKGKGGNAVAIALSTFLNQESCFPYFFDVIDYQSIDHQPLIDHINRVGKLIYIKSSENQNLEPVFKL